MTNIELRTAIEAELKNIDHAINNMVLANSFEIVKAMAAKRFWLAMLRTLRGVGNCSAYDYVGIGLCQCDHISHEDPEHDSSYRAAFTRYVDIVMKADN